MRSEAVSAMSESARNELAKMPPFILLASRHRCFIYKLRNKSANGRESVKGTSPE